MLGKMSNDWQARPLGKLARLTMGQSPDSKFYTDDDSQPPFLQGCADFGARHPTPSIYCTRGNKIAEAGSLLCSVRAPVGRTNTADQKYVIGRGVAAIEALLVNQDYLDYYVSFIAPALRASSQGSTFEAINSADLASWPIEFPASMAEQGNIAQRLKLLDASIDRVAIAIYKNERIKVGLVQDLLRYGIDGSGHVRSVDTHDFKKSPLGLVPVEWKVGNIINFASRMRQPILTGPFGAQLGTKDFVEEGVPVLRIGNVQAGYVDQADLHFVSPRKAAQLSRYQVQAGDLLFARQGATTGRNALAGAAEQGFLINYHIIRVATDPAKCSPTFLYAAFNSDMVQSQVEREKGKSKREGVNTATLLGFLLPVPPFEEQERIADVLEAHSLQTEHLKMQHKKLGALKTGIMQDLLTGKKRVTDLLEQQDQREKIYA